MPTSKQSTIKASDFIDDAISFWKQEKLKVLNYHKINIATLKESLKNAYKQRVAGYMKDKEDLYVYVNDDVKVKFYDTRYDKNGNVEKHAYFYMFNETLRAILRSKKYDEVQVNLRTKLSFTSNSIIIDDVTTIYSMDDIKHKALEEKYQELEDKVKTQSMLIATLQQQVHELRLSTMFKKD